MLIPSSMINVLTLAFLWGPSFLFTKLAINEVAPITLITIRVGLSALLLLLLLKFKKIALPWDWKLWKQCFIMGIFGSSMPFILFGYSLESIQSVLSALINGTTPIMTVLLAHFFLKDERITLNRFLGITLGLTGFLLLVAPKFFTETLDIDLSGIFYSFFAACCYAIGMVYARKNIKPPKEPLVLPALQLATSTFYLIPLSLLCDPPLHIFELSPTFWMSVLGLSILGTVLAFIVYYRVVINYGATTLSSVTYILPLFSAVLGMVFLGEVLTLNFCLAAALILLGTLFVNGVIKINKSKSSLNKVPT